MGIELGSSAVPTIGQMMALHGNDYSREAEIFTDALRKESAHKIELVTETPLDEHTIHNHIVDPWQTRKTLSIIVPIRGRANHFEKCLEVLAEQSFITARPELVELLVVFDGPEDPDADAEQNIPLWAPHDIRTRTFRLLTKSGASTARNVGLYFAQGDVVLFLDCDMLLSGGFLMEHMLRHEYLNNLALLGFRTDINLGDPDCGVDSSGRLKFATNWKGDWRVRAYDVKIVSRLNGVDYNPGNVVHIFDATRAFRNWEGHINHRHLPSVFQTCCASVSRTQVMATGGFPEAYHGWGIEDRDVGARLLARGVRLVPCCSSAARHIKHTETPQKATDEEENLRRYKQLMREPFREDSHRITRQVEALLDDGQLTVGYQHEKGNLLPGRTPSHIHFTPLGCRSLAPLARSLFVHTNDTVCRLSEALADSLKNKTFRIGPSDLKWNLMWWDTKIDTIVQLCSCNMADDPDRNLSLPAGSGFVGQCLQAINGRITGTPQELRERVSGGDALFLDLLNTTDDWKSEALKMSKEAIAVTKHITFINSYPIRVWREAPGTGPFFCVGFVNVHSSRSELRVFFGDPSASPRIPVPELPTAHALMLYTEIDKAIRSVRDTIEDVWSSYAR